MDSTTQTFHGLIEKWNKASPLVSSVIKMFCDLQMQDSDICSSLAAVKRVCNRSPDELNFTSKISADLEIMGRPATRSEGGLSQTTCHPDDLNGNDVCGDSDDFDNKLCMIEHKHPGDPSRFEKSISDVGLVAASGGNTLRTLGTELLT